MGNLWVMIVAAVVLGGGEWFGGLIVGVLLQRLDRGESFGGLRMTEIEDGVDWEEYHGWERGL